MRPPRSLVLAAGLALTLGATGAMGGWAVVTVENPPTALPAAAPYSLHFTIRQHGREPLDDLSPTVRLLAAGVQPVASPEVIAARPDGRRGGYVATLVAPASGTLRVTIASGFGQGRRAELALLPIPVRAGPVAAPAPTGEALFVAKGCGTCHLNGDLPPGAAANQSFEVGPELTGRQLEAGYVRQRLTDPGSLPAIGQTMVRMPDLGLAPAEVDALVSYLSGPRGTGGR